MSRQTLGGIERGTGRATPDVQAKLGELYGLPVDELFEPEREHHYRVGDDGDWTTASEVERLLEITGEGVRELVRRGVLARRGGPSRRQFHRPTVEALVPAGFLRIGRLLRRLDALAAELGARPFTAEQLARRRRRGELRTIQPWPGAEHRVAPEEVEPLERELRQRAERERRRRRRRGDVPEQLKAWTGSARNRVVLRESRERRLAALVAVDEEIARRGLHDEAETARLLDVDEHTVRYYRLVGLIVGERVQVGVAGKWAYSDAALAEHLRTIAKNLPAPDDERDPAREKLGRHGVHLVERKHVANEVSKGNVEPGSPDEKEARRRVRRRRKTILPRTARVTVAASAGGSNKGAKEAQEARRLALEIIGERPHLSRRALVDSVVVRLFGPDAVMVDRKRRRSSRDPVYRSARKKVDTRLARSFKDEGVPPELAHLFEPPATLFGEPFPG